MRRSSRDWWPGDGARIIQQSHEEIIVSTLDELRIVIAKITHCDEQDIILETALNDIKADSLQWLQIIIGTEMALNIEIDIDSMKELVTIEDFVKLTESYIK